MTGGEPRQLTALSSGDKEWRSWPPLKRKEFEVFDDYCHRDSLGLRWPWLETKTRGKKR